MSKLFRLTLAVAILGFGWPMRRLSAQQPAEQRAAAAPDVLLLARKTVDAIRNKDTAVFASMVDPEGIAVGVDVPKMGAARFKRELAEKRGVYCAIFDATCLQIKGGSSLRDVLERQPVTTSISRIQGAPTVAAVVVRKAENSGEEIITFVYRRVSGKWVLQQIEYL